MPLADILRRSTEKNPEAIALVSEGRTTTYAELDRWADQVAWHMRERGVRHGDRVALLLPNIPEFVAGYLGTVRIGATVVPQNTAYTQAELDYQVRDAGARVIITSCEFLPRVKSQGGLIGELKEFILAEEIADGKRRKPPSVRINDSTDVAAILYTSGTTGHPKGAMLTHRNLLADSKACAKVLECGRQEVFLCVLPLFHAFAATVCMLLPLLVGARIVLLRKFNPGETLATIAREGVTIFAGVPSMYAVWASCQPAGLDFSSWRLAISGGAALPVEVLKRFEERYGVTVIEGDGPTECSPVTSCNPVRGVRKPGSIGLPIPGVKMAIVNEEDKLLPAHERGEIVVRGPTVMKGYWRQPEATAEALRNGWYHTGDIGEMDSDGYFYIVDRKKDMVIVGGLNVYPREVEEVLSLHPHVCEVAVIGIPDALHGEVVKACIIPRQGVDPCEREIIAFCRKRLAPFKVPRRLEFRTELPRTPSGKVLKRALR